MRRITLEWSYPIDFNNILYDERMEDIGLYYITRTFGDKTSDLYIGKTTYGFGSRLKSHAYWLDNYRGIKQVRLGYLVSPKNVSFEDKKMLIEDAEKTLIWLMRKNLIQNKMCMYDCYPQNRLLIKNIGYRGHLPAEAGFTDAEWNGEF